jgi:minimal PKS acyl carrier protein
MTMSDFTLEDLAELLRECAGDAGELELDRDFVDIGYDSLALMQAASQIELRFGIRLADEAVAEADSPRRLLAIVNDLLAATR